MIYNKTRAIYAYIVLIIGIVLTLFPIWFIFSVATAESGALLQGSVPYVPRLDLSNFWKVIIGDETVKGVGPVFKMLYNSFIMAVGIASGKIIISLLSAYAIIFFRFPLRNFFFWLIYITLLLPIGTRIIPTYEVAAQLGMLNSYTGLILPLIVSATATFFFRQYYLTIPNELVEAAKIDRVGPIRFFFDIVLPLSRTNIAAMFVILFVYGWNQYLWPLLITTDERYYTVVMGFKSMLNVADGVPQWHFIMAIALLAIIPTAIVIIVMQKLFVKALISYDK